MKNFLKKKKQQQVVEPRELEEIRREFAELSQRASNAQYVMFVNGKDLENINKRLIEVNQEAQARQNLDAAKAQAAKSEESSDVKA